MTWRKDSLCFGEDTNDYYERYEDDQGHAQAIDETCLECPIQRRCFAEGVSSKEWGVWGGIYFEEGLISSEFNRHKSPEDWSTIWEALTTELEVQ